MHRPVSGPDSLGFLEVPTSGGACVSTHSREQRTRRGRKSDSAVQDFFSNVRRGILRRTKVEN